jgi:ABC-2 type transport system permease protein
MTTTHTVNAGTLRLYTLETKYELLKAARMPGYSVPAIAFPVMFYVLFGLLLAPRGPRGLSMATYLIATYGAFGVIGAALFGFGVGVAVERGQGWLTLKRATPMPPAAFFAARFVMCAAFSAAIVFLLSVLGAAFGGVSLSPAVWVRLSATLILGGIPFCAMGLALAYLVGPNAAPPIVNLIYLPMGFLSGLWIPIEFLPPAIKAIAPFMPAYHFAQLALKAVAGSAGSPVWPHVTALAGFTLLGLGVALWAYRRDDA